MGHVLSMPIESTLWAYIRILALNRINMVFIVILPYLYVEIKGPVFLVLNDYILVFQDASKFSRHTY